MLACLPLIFVVVVAAAVYLRWPKTDGIAGFRPAILAAMLTAFALVAVSTEILSLLHAVNRTWVAVTWLAAVLAAAAWLAAVMRRSRGAGAHGSMPPAEADPSQSADRPNVTRPGIFTTVVFWTLAAALAAVVGVVFAVAIITPPNVWDSMTYHMSRVSHWIQNAGVEHYPTHVIRQLYLPPLAEYAAMHLQLLSRGDRYANLVQFAAFAGSLVGVSLIARQLGGSRMAQLAAAVICAAIPMGLLQASSNQNDYLLAFFMVCLTWAVLELRGGFNWRWLIAAAVSVALACLTKPTTFVYAVGPIVLLAAMCIRRMGWRSWKPAIAVIGIVLALNAGQWSRNWATFGSSLGRHVGPDGRMITVNQAMNGPMLAGNIARNISLHLSTPDARTNQRVERAVLRLHQEMGESPNDERTTFPNTTYSVIPIQYHQDLAPCGLHLLLGIAVTVVIFTFRRLRGGATQAYWLSLAAAFVLFCALLRWQPWHSRLHLPLFVLGAPLAAVCLAGLWRWLAPAAAMALLAAAIPFLLFDPMRPLGGPASVFNASRGDMYFVARPGVKAAYQQAAEEFRLSGLGNLAIHGYEDAWEYPMWVLTDAQARGIHIEHVNVKNVTRNCRPEKPAQGGWFIMEISPSMVRTRIQPDRPAD